MWKLFKDDSACRMNKSKVYKSQQKFLIGHENNNNSSSNNNSNNNDITIIKKHLLFFLNVWSQFSQGHISLLHFHAQVHTCTSKHTYTLSMVVLATDDFALQETLGSGEEAISLTGV